MQAIGYVTELDSALREIGDAERARGAKAYLKSELEFMGVPAQPLREVARAFLERHPELDREELAFIVRALWKRPVYELKAVAVALLERRVAILEPRDLELVEELLRQSHTWALVDWLCTKIAAPLVELDAEIAEDVLRAWSRDGDFWLRRASMLAQLPALRAGDGDFGLFAEFAESMLSEKEFFIRKAIGWVLRDVSKKRPELVRAFLDVNLEDVSSLSLREATRYLPDEQRRELQRRRSDRG